MKPRQPTHIQWLYRSTLPLLILILMSSCSGHQAAEGTTEENAETSETTDSLDQEASTDEAPPITVAETTESVVDENTAPEKDSALDEAAAVEPVVDETPVELNAAATESPPAVEETTPSAVEASPFQEAATPVRKLATKKPRARAIPKTQDQNPTLLAKAEPNPPKQEPAAVQAASEPVSTPMPIETPMPPPNTPAPPVVEQTPVQAFTQPPQPEESKPTPYLLYAGAGLVVAAGAFFFMKKRK
jgi:hypothetical protein